MATENICAHHPDRPSVGICVTCRQFVCDECVTRIQGVNHCRECLEKLYEPVKQAGRMEKDAPGSLSWAGVIGLSGLLLLMLYLGLTFVLVD